MPADCPLQITLLPLGSGITTVPAYEVSFSAVVVICSKGGVPASSSVALALLANTSISFASYTIPSQIF